MATKYATWNGNEEHNTVAEAVAQLSDAKDYVYAVDDNTPRQLNDLELVQEKRAKEAGRDNQPAGKDNSRQEAVR